MIQMTSSGFMEPGVPQIQDLHVQGLALSPQSLDQTVRRSCGTIKSFGLAVGLLPLHH